jgi:hypothetical protein
MPITPFLNGERFDPETRRVLGVALELTCIVLRVEDCDDGVKQAVATKLIDLPRLASEIPTCCASECWRKFARRRAVKKGPARLRDTPHRNDG